MGVYETLCSQHMLVPKDNLIKKCSQKREIIQSHIYRILLIVNQVIYTLDTICEPNIMTLAQAVLQIFCSQGCFTTQNDSWKREIIQSNLYRVLPEVNQVIYTLDTFCMPNTMTLAQAVLQICCSQGPLWVTCLSPKRGIIQSNFDRMLWKVNR